MLCAPVEDVTGVVLNIIESLAMNLHEVYPYSKVI